MLSVRYQESRLYEIKWKRCYGTQTVPMEVQTCEKDERKLDTQNHGRIEAHWYGKKEFSWQQIRKKYVRKTESVDKLVSHVVTIAEGSKDEPTLKLADKKCFDFLGQNRLLEE